MSLSRPPVSAALLDMGDVGDHAVPPVRVPVAGAAVTDDDGIRRASASCGVCPWTAIIRGDTDEEIFEFLRLLLADHLTTMHVRRRGIHE
jgi:hypothetical protein